MAEQGIHATITADSSDFVGAVDKAKASAASLTKSLHAGLGFTAKSYQDVIGKSTGLDTAIKKSSGNFKLMKGSMQQAGYQIQDFAVQVAAGQSPLVAFGQQASQLAGILGPGGAVIGAVIAVGAALAGVILKMGSATESTQELTDKVNGLNEALKRTELFKINDDIQLSAERMGELSDKLDKAQSKLDGLKFGPQMAEFAQVTKVAEQDVKNLTRAFQFEKTELERLNQVRETMSKGDGLSLEADKDKQAAENRVKALVAGMDKEIAADLAMKQARLALTNQFATSDTERLQAKLTAQNLMIADALTAQQITEQEARDFKTAAEQAHADGITAIWNKSVTDRAQVEEQAQARIRAMRESVAANAAGLLSVLGRKNKAAALAAIILTKGMAIAQTLAHTQTAAMLAYASQLVPGDPTSPARAAAAYAHTQALGKLSAGLIAATGLAELTGGGVGGGGGGGGGGGSVASNTAGAAAQQQRSNQIVNINLEGEVFGREQIRGLIGQINDAFDDGFKLNLG
jgi:hypothetical protein